MKTRAEIESRVRELVCSELDHRVSEAAQRLPTRCVNNHRHPLDTRDQVEGEPNPGFNRITDKRGLPVLQTIGLCMLGSEDPENWEGTICEEPIDAKKCPDFKPLKTKADILPDLAANLKDVEWLKSNMPELFSLLWVLDTIEEFKVPLWKRILFYIFRLRIEPVVPKIDTTKLLSAPSSDSTAVESLGEVNEPPSIV